MASPPQSSSRLMKLFSAVLYGTVSFLIMVVNKIVLTTHGFPSPMVLGLGQMVSAIVVLLLLRRLRVVSFPAPSVAVVRRVFPLPLFYVGNLVSGFIGTQKLSLPMFTVLRRFSIVMTMLAEYYILQVRAPPLVLTSVAAMVGGAVIAAFGDLGFDAAGYASVLLNDLFTAANGVYTRKRLVDESTSAVNVAAVAGTAATTILDGSTKAVADAGRRPKINGPHAVVENGAADGITWSAGSVAGSVADVCTNVYGGSGGGGGSAIRSSAAASDQNDVGAPVWQARASRAPNVEVRRAYGAGRELGKYGLLFYNALLMLPPLAVAATLSGDLARGVAFDGWSSATFQLHFAASCLMGFALMYSTLLCTAHNSALTTTIVGCLKNIMTTYVGMYVGGDYVFSVNNLIGVNVSMAGSLMYSYVTFMQKENGNNRKSESNCKNKTRCSADTVSLGRDTSDEREPLVDMLPEIKVAR